MRSPTRADVISCRLWKRAFEPRGTDAFLWAQSVTECYKILQSITRYWKVLQRSEPLSSGTDAFLWAQSVTECCKILQSIKRYWKVLQRSEPLSPAAKMPFSGILSWPPTPALAISPLQTFTRQQLKYCKIIWTWPAHWEEKVSRLLFRWRPAAPLAFHQPVALFWTTQCQTCTCTRAFESKKSGNWF